MTAATWAVQDGVCYSCSMSEVKLNIPVEALLALKLSGDALASEIRMSAAVKLYELGRLSSGAAAKLAGVPRVVFLMKLADYGVDTFQISEADLEADVAHAEALVRA